eukprot:scaffold128522_cov31-Tisochrysis_lutea.AAC.1
MFPPTIDIDSHHTSFSDFRWMEWDDVTNGDKKDRQCGGEERRGRVPTKHPHPHHQADGVVVVVRLLY